MKHFSKEFRWLSGAEEQPPCRGGVPGPIFTYLPGAHRPNVLLCTILYHCTQLDYSNTWYLDIPVVCLGWVGSAAFFHATDQVGLKDAQQITSLLQLFSFCSLETCRSLGPCSPLNQAFLFFISIITHIKGHGMPWALARMDPLCFKKQREIRRAQTKARLLQTQQLLYMLWKPEWA